MSIVRTVGGMTWNKLLSRPSKEDKDRYVSELGRSAKCAEVTVLYAYNEREESFVGQESMCSRLREMRSKKR